MMGGFSIYSLALIQDHFVFKLFLWTCLLLLAIYIIFIEFKIFRKDKQIKKKDGKAEDVAEEERKLSFYELKAKKLLILLIAIAVITIVLTFTY